jgi:hypothetical protein
MAGVAETVRLLGGIASTGELLRRGIPRDWIRMAVDYGRILRVRRGWFASLDIPEVALQARRAGGRLACVSALKFHRQAEQGHAALHIAVSRHSSRLVSAIEGREVVIHWCRREPSGDALAVSVEEAWAQRARCRALRHG